MKSSLMDAARWVGERLTYANVVSTIALFGVLAGGYAVAFSGKGSLRQGHVFPEHDERLTVVGLPGIGSLKAECGDGSITQLYVKNASGKALSVHAVAGTDTGGNAFVFGADIADGSTEPMGGVGGGENWSTMRLTIYPSGKSSRPQASVNVDVDRGCGTDGGVAAQVLSSEE